MGMHKRQRKTGRPSWAESKTAAALTAAMLILFLSYTLYMFVFFEFPGLTADRGTLRIYFSTLGILVLTAVATALVARFFQKKHRNGGQNK